MPTAAILTIGICRFDPDAKEIGEKLYLAVDLDDAVRHGTVSGSTLSWWMDQSREAQTAAFRTGPRVKLRDALAEVAKFYEATGSGDACIWSNGATFDAAILEHQFRRQFGKVPWRFWSIRDVRTIVDLAEGKCVRPRMPDNEAHNALNDAVHQANYVSAMWRALRG